MLGLKLNHVSKRVAVLVYFALTMYCRKGVIKAFIQQMFHCRSFGLWQGSYLPISFTYTSIQWRYYERDAVSNHGRRDCLLNRLLRLRSKKTSKHRVTCLCEGTSPVIGEFPAERASYAQDVSIWLRHIVLIKWHVCWFLSTAMACTGYTNDGLNNN